MEDDLVGSEERILADYSFFCQRIKINSSSRKGLAAFKSYLLHGVHLPEYAVVDALKKLNETFHFESHA